MTQYSTTKAKPQAYSNPKTMTVQAHQCSNIVGEEQADLAGGGGRVKCIISLELLCSQKHSKSVDPYLVPF